uniref:NKG2-D type II integral membrane protein-like n=1 Tax=Crassostrea virginica TaxID=6565 RepID=A0A8B8BXJ6_CRAVI|nr:NKG2-D type II integral membrane protein-like [Crassostrea virginica]
MEDDFLAEVGTFPALPTSREGQMVPAAVGTSTPAPDSATQRPLSKKSIIFIIFTLVTFLAISLISLAVLSTIFILKKTNIDKGTTAQATLGPTIDPSFDPTLEPTLDPTLDPTYHCQEDTPEPTSCEDGWLFSNKSCYWINTEELTWDEAEAACRRQSATLAEITSEEEINFIRTMTNYYLAWFAGRYSEEQEGWINSCSNSSRTFNNHDDNFGNFAGDCVRWDFVYWKFRNAVCTEKLSSVCEGNFKYT